MQIYIITFNTSIWKLTLLSEVLPLIFKDVRGWQFLKMKAAETLCVVCLPPEKTYFLKKIVG